MTSTLRQLVALVIPALGVASASTACRIGEDTWETVHVPIIKPSATKVCDSPTIKVDPSGLKACGTSGKSHCYDSTKVPIPDDQVDPCDEPGQVCVPDKLLELDGGKLKSCTFTATGTPAPGACMSSDLPQMKANAAFLKQDVCDPDELCAPCTNPLDGTDTLICDPGGGAHQDACVGGSTGPVETCCHYMGTCSTGSGLTADQRSNMQQDTCKTGELCVPAGLTSGKVTKCSLPLGFSGVCLDLCFASMFSTTTNVTRASCGPTEVCMPCALGKGQGLPGCD